jgi:two-component system cell cycle sensor histidine kinase/response regulator CckA
MTSGFDGAERPACILIVDDERQARQILEAMLNPEGFTFQMAKNGEEALAMVAKQAPDLVLVDLMMPGMDGYVLAATLKGNPATRGIPVIMITALDDRESRMRGRDAGAEDFMTKPVERADLCVRVRNLLRLKAHGDYHDKYSQMLEGEVGSRAVDLVESERLYRSTFDAAPVGIAHMSLTGEWLRVNQRLCDLLGYSRNELQSVAGQTAMECDSVAGEAESFAQMAAGTLDRYVVNEKRYTRRDGGFVWARVNMSVHRDSGGESQHYISVLEDITESRALEAQVRQASKMDAIGRLASGIAHDFNNILSVIMSYSEMLADDLTDIDPMRADLHEIRAAGARAVELTRQLLAFSRQQVLQPKLVDMNEIVAGMGKMLKRLIGASVELHADAAACTSNILVDPGQLEQVIMNLVVNARDAMPGGGTIRIGATEAYLDEAYASKHAGVKPGPHVRLAVSDTGVGMDKLTQARMFEPFFTTKEPGKGTGLGLATVFGIVRQSGGTIWVDSEPGRGTSFEIYFPTAQGLDDARPAVSTPDLGSLRGTETILLVENELPVRVLAGAILRRCGYHVLESESSGDAFLLCEQHPATIHLLLTDVVMPRMNGRQLAERLLMLHPEMKVLYMSGYTDDPIVRQGASAATVGFLQKPITPEMLARKVRETLASGTLLA